MSLEWATQLTDIMGLGPAADSDLGKVTKQGGFDDQTLIAQVLERNSQIHFRLLIERHQKQVHDLVCSVLGPLHKGAAEEVSQEVFIKIYRKLNAFRGESSFATWAYRIAYNTALDKLRELKRRRPERPLTEALDQRVDEQAGPCATLSANEEGARLRAAVEQLPELYQTLIRLHYWRGLTIIEIASLLESKSGTIKSYLHRARLRFAQTVGESA